MTYFRYDNNKRGFDMSGIEWEIYSGTADHRLESVGGKHPTIRKIELDGSEKYNTYIKRGSHGIATLNEFDTARFIEVITDAKSNRPKVIRSSAEYIELFLNPFKANAVPAPELLWYMDGDLLKHCNAPKDKRSVHYVIEHSMIDDDYIVARLIKEQPVLTDSELHMLHSPNNSSSDCVTMLYKILNRDE